MTHPTQAHRLQMGFFNGKGKSFKKLLLKPVALAIVSCLLSQAAFAADPRAMAASSKKYFVAFEEERNTRRSSEQLLAAENQKLALIDQQNALLSLQAANSSEQSPSPKKQDPLPEGPTSEHAEYDDVGGLDPVLADAPPRPGPIINYTLDLLADSLINTHYQIFDTDSQTAAAMERSAQKLFRNTAFNAMFGFLQAGYPINRIMLGQGLPVYDMGSFGTLSYSLIKILGYEHYIFGSTATDRQGNSFSFIADNTSPYLASQYLPEFEQHFQTSLDFKLSRGRSSFNTTSIIDRPGFLPLLSKFGGGISVSKIRETGKDTYWDIYEGADRVASVTDAGSAHLNSAIWGFQEPVWTSELFENGLTTKIDIIDLTAPASEPLSVMIRKRPESDRIIYNAKSQVVDGVIADRELENPDQGFRITMEGGKMVETKLGDSSLYGQVQKIIGARKGLLVTPAAYGDFKKMAHIIEKKYDDILNQDQWNEAIRRLKGLADKADLSGEISFFDDTRTFNDEDFQEKIRVQGGFYFREPSTGAPDSTKYDAAYLSFSPNLTENGVATGESLRAGLIDNRSFELSAWGTDVQEYGLFGELGGKISNLADVAPKGNTVPLGVDARAGYFSDMKEEIGGKTDSFGAKTFVEIGIDGKQWVGLVWKYINRRGQFFKIEFKARLLKSEEEASKVVNGVYNYLLEKLVLGSLSGKETKAMSQYHTETLASYLYTQTIKGINMLLGSADSSIGEMVDDFKSQIQPKLLNFYRNHIQLAPIISQSISLNRGNPLALHLESNSTNKPIENFSQRIISVGRKYVDFFSSLI